MTNEEIASHITKCLLIFQPRNITWRAATTSALIVRWEHELGFERARGLIEAVKTAYSAGKNVYEAVLDYLFVPPLGLTRKRSIDKTDECPIWDTLRGGYMESDAQRRRR